MQNYSKVLTTVEEIDGVKNTIYLSVKKQNIITRGFPYEELNEDGFIGFVSDMFQYYQTVGFWIKRIHVRIFSQITLKNSFGHLLNIVRIKYHMEFVIK